MFRLVLRFRLRKPVEELVVRGWGSVQAFERFVNQQPGRQLGEVEHVRYLAGRRVDLGRSEVLVAGPLKLVVAEPLRQDPLRLPSIVALANASKEDRWEAFGGRPVDGPICFLGSRTDVEAPWDLEAARALAQHKAVVEKTPKAEKAVSAQSAKSARPFGGRKMVRLRGGVDYYPLYSDLVDQPGLVRFRCSKRDVWFTDRVDSMSCRLCGEAFAPPSCPYCDVRLIPGRGLFCVRCGLKLAPGLAVPVDLAVELHERLFLRLPQFRRDMLNVAYGLVASGRDERRVRVGGNVSVVHLQVRNEWTASSLETINRLAAVLEEAAVGRVIADPYELTLVRQRLSLAEPQENRPGEQ